MEILTFFNAVMFFHFYPLIFLMIYILFIQIEYYYYYYYYFVNFTLIREMIVKEYSIIIFGTIYETFLDYVSVH